MKLNYADKLIRSADVVNILKENIDNGTIVPNLPIDGKLIKPALPVAESQARPLARFKETPTILCKIWQNVIDAAYQDRKKITAGLVIKIVKAHLGKPVMTQEEEDLEFIEAEKDRYTEEFSDKMLDILKYIQNEIDNGCPGTSRYAMLSYFKAMVSIAKTGETTSEVKFRQIISKSLNKKEAKRLGSGVVQLEGKRKNNQ